MVTPEIIAKAKAYAVGEMMHSRNFDTVSRQSTPEFIEIPDFGDSIKKAFACGGGFTIRDESLKPLWLVYYNPDFSLEFIGEQIEGGFDKVKINPGEVKQIARELHEQYHSKQLVLF
jgi:hypothetical protein